MENEIGRSLTKQEVVHHEDEDSTNDEPDNLELFASQKEHMLTRHPQEWAWQMLKSAIRELGIDAVKEYVDAQ
jgi:hypothetical protein